ncbi:hypothetical protein [uncultured Martelella sp.]|uniref:hypothetical protein n=1 Tax=uncultured Martelella sp. TaxID=392331 RepID=UPI0029C66A6F|nr:hypothetical protein [uncultured Martelella sp.]
MTSFLAAIHRAVKPGADDDSLIEGEPGADASNVEPADEASATEEDHQMSEEKKTPGANDKPAGADTSAVAKDASDATKARIKAITGSAKAKGREGLASHLAFETDMSAEAAEALMATAPKAEEGNKEESYEERRVSASGLAQPSAGNGPKKSGLSAAVDLQIDALKK